MNETMTLTENPSIAKRDTVRLTTAPSCLRFQSCNTNRLSRCDEDGIRESQPIDLRISAWL